MWENQAFSHVPHLKPSGIKKEDGKPLRREESGNTSPATPARPRVQYRRVRSEGHPWALLSVCTASQTTSDTQDLKKASRSWASWPKPWPCRAFPSQNYGRLLLATSWPRPGLPILTPQKSPPFPTPFWRYGVFLLSLRINEPLPAAAAKPPVSQPTGLVKPRDDQRQQGAAGRGLGGRHPLERSHRLSSFS